MKFGTYIEPNVNLRCAKFQTCKLISFFLIEIN